MEFLFEEHMSLFLLVKNSGYSNDTSCKNISFYHNETIFKTEIYVIRKVIWIENKYFQRVYQNMLQLKKMLLML